MGRWMTEGMERIMTIVWLRAVAVPGECLHRGM